MSTWKKVIIADVTGAGNDWATDTLRASGFTVGMNPELFAIDDVTLEPGDRVELAGARLYQLLVQHEIVILQHFPAASLIERLKKDGVEEVLLWVGYESIPQKPLWSIFSEPLYRLGMKNRLIVSEANAFGEFWVDAYETAESDPPEKPHTFAVDVMKKGYPAEFIQCLGNILFQVYGNVHPRLFFDNCLDREYHGTASNAPNRNDPKRIELWRASWKEMLGYCRKLSQTPLWGNCGATNHEYPELDCKFDELIFTAHLSPEEIANMVTQSMVKGGLDRHGHEQGFCFHVANWSGAGEWAMNPDKWVVLKEAITEKPCYVCTARTGSFLFHPGRRICT